MLTVSAIIVTRGNVDLDPIWDSMPDAWEKIAWVNGRNLEILAPHGDWPWESWLCGEDHPRPWRQDLAVYGRYAAIEYAQGDVIYVQDDDCIVSDPGAIVAAWEQTQSYDFQGDFDHKVADPDEEQRHVVCNMPERFRHAFYERHALVGFGAAFARRAPMVAVMEQMRSWVNMHADIAARPPGFFERTCDIAFTYMSERVLVDVPVSNLEYASDPDRMWRQASHQSERNAMLLLCDSAAKSKSGLGALAPGCERRLPG